MFVEECNISKLFASCSIDRICKSWMIRVQFRSIRQDLVGKLVKILDLSWEPWNCLWIVFNVSGDDLEVAGFVLNNFQCSLNVSNFGVNLNHKLITRHLTLDLDSICRRFTLYSLKILRASAKAPTASVKE